MLKSGFNRTDNYFNQIKLSFALKVFAIGCSFFVVPLLIKLLGNEQYGIWSTLLSISSWIVLFDFGIGNGVKNKIAEAIAKDRPWDVRIYISTAYFINGVILITIFLLFLLTSFHVPWDRFFNTSSISKNNLRNVVFVFGSFLLLNFWLNLLNQIASGLQKTSISILNQLIVNLLFLLVIIVFNKSIKNSLVGLSFGYGISLIASSISLTIWFFKKYPAYSPTVKQIEIKYISSITNLGIQFFIIQIAVVVLFTMNKIIITQMFGPQYVTQYDVVLKLFSVISLLHNILMTPLWPAYSDAYHHNDMQWIKNTIGNQIKLYLLIVFITVLLVFFSPFIFKLWLGSSFILDKNLIVAMMFFILVSTWNSIFACLINATSKIFLATAINSILLIINIPICIGLIRFYNLGIEGVVYGTTICLSIGAILGPLQYYYIINNKGHKVWHL